MKDGAPVALPLSRAALLGGVPGMRAQKLARAEGGGYGVPAGASSFSSWHMARPYFSPSGKHVLKCGAVGQARPGRPGSFHEDQ